MIVARTPTNLLTSLTETELKLIFLEAAKTTPIVGDPPTRYKNPLLLLLEDCVKGNSLPPTERRHSRYSCASYKNIIIVKAFYLVLRYDIRNGTSVVTIA